MNENEESQHPRLQLHYLLTSFPYYDIIIYVFIQLSTDI